MKKTHQRFSRQYWNDSTFAENTQEPDLNLADLAATLTDDNIRIDPIATDFSEQDPIDRLLADAGFDDIAVNAKADTVLSDTTEKEPCLELSTVQEKITTDIKTNDFALESFIADCLINRNTESKEHKQTPLIVEPVLLEADSAPEPLLPIDNEAFPIADENTSTTAQTANTESARQDPLLQLLPELQDAVQRHSAALSQQIKHLQITIIFVAVMLCMALFGLGILYSQQSELKTEATLQKQWLELIKEDLTSLTLDKEP